MLTFKGCESSIYFNAAAYGLQSTNTTDAVVRMAKALQDPINASSLNYVPWINETKVLLAEMLHTQSANLAFVQNTSTALSIAASSIHLKAGDEVLYLEDEFPSGRYLAQSLSVKGIKPRIISRKANETYVEALANHDLDKVRLFIFSAVSYKTGYNADLKSIGEFCRANKIITIVDGMQAVGAIDINLSKTPIDFLAGGGRKWLLSPIGCAYLYIAPEILNKVNSTIIGWLSAENYLDFDLAQLSLAHDARKCEAGIYNLLPLAGMKQSLKDLTEIGWNNIFHKIHQHVKSIYQGLLSLDMKPLAPLEASAGIVSVKLPEANDLYASRLKNNNIIATNRRNILRFSPHIYNTPDDITYLLETITQ